MWHEARKHEKKIRVMIVDYRKRAERRREFYEKFKADPTQFMQVHGRPIKIYMDPQITAAAEKCLMPWQGNSETTIDRFDVRAHLDIIPEPSSHSKHEVTDETEQPGLNYERYRILIQNEIAGISEDKFLHQIHIEEQYGTTVPLIGNKADAVTKPKQTKAAIAYTYDDSTPNASSLSCALVKPSAAAEIAAASEENSDEDLDFDLLVNVNDMTMAQKADLNNSGTKYGLAPGDFMNFLNAEIKEKEDLRLAKLHEEEKQAMSGRKARRERRAYKDRIIMRKGYVSPPSYAATNSPTSDRSHRSSSRSRSNSNSPEKIEYITCFGENEKEEGKKRTNMLEETSTFGPSLPPSGIPITRDKIKRLSRSRSRSQTPEGQKNRQMSKSPLPEKNTSNKTKFGNAKKHNSSASSSSHSSQHEKTRERRGRRKRSHSSSSSLTSRTRSSSSRKVRRSKTRSRTRSRSRSRSYNYERTRNDLLKSRSRYRRRSSSERRTGSRSRKGYRSRRRSRSSSISSKSRSRSSRRRFNESWRNTTDSRTRTKDTRRTSKSSTRSSSPTSRSDSSNTRLRQDKRDEYHQTKSDSKTNASSSGANPMKLPSPPVKRYYGREKSKEEDRSSASSFDSDSDDDKTEMKYPSNKAGSVNERNRSSGTKSKPSVSSSSKVQFCGESSKTGRVKPQDRLKRRMQTALNRQLKADKDAERSRFARQEQERLEREESLRELSIKYRRKERERRHRTHTDRDSRSCSTSSLASSHSATSHTDLSGRPCREF